MSRTTPPPAMPPAGMPDPERKPNPQAQTPGAAAQAPNNTTPMAPSVGASAPPNKAGQPADRAHSRPPHHAQHAAHKMSSPPGTAGGNGAPKAAPPGAPGTAKPGAKPVPGAPPAAGGMPPIDQLQGRPIGRVLTKMGKVTRDQVVEALTFQKEKGGAVGRILIDLGYLKEHDLNIALAAQRGYEWLDLENIKISAQ